MPTLRSRTRLGVAKARLIRFKIHSTVKSKVGSKAVKVEKDKAGKVTGKVKGNESSKVSKTLEKNGEGSKKGARKSKDTPAKSKSGVAAKPAAPTKGKASSKGAKKADSKVTLTKGIAKRTVKGAVATKEKPTAAKGSKTNKTLKPKFRPKKGGSTSATAVAGTVDSGVLPTHKHCGLRLDARLAFVDPAINSDKYYILQLLDDAGGVHWVWTRWGRTGQNGQGKMEGPLDLAAATTLFNKIFREKTGVEHDAAVAGAAHVAGKYAWLDTAGDAGRPVGTWEYYVDDGVDGKATGWCDAIQPSSCLDFVLCRGREGERKR